jgi:hypothetical protein
MKLIMFGVKRIALVKLKGSDISYVSDIHEAIAGLWRGNRSP